MKHLHLGFVGGCLTHQPGVPFPQLFHRVLARRFADDHLVRLTLAVSNDYLAEPRLRIARLILEQRPDVIILHRSTNTFFTKAMALFVSDDGRYIVNPYLVHRRRSRSWIDEEREGFRRCLGVRSFRRRPSIGAEGFAWGTKAAPSPADLRLIHEAAKRRRFRVRDLAWIAADWTGLVEWAIADEARIVHEATAACAAESVPLVVLGPALRIGMPWVERCSRRLDQRLAHQAARDGGFAYVSMLAPSTATLEPGPIDIGHYQDVIHFNAAGHSLVAARLERHLARIVEARQAVTDPASA